ncbi:MAG: RidA family protein [Chitinophagaceae bacterium]|nr:RidA family protein [Chitinophagaceae bacterium]
MRKFFFTSIAILFSIFVSAQTDPEKKLKELNITLPTPGKPMANYVKYVQTGKLIYLAGHGPQKADGTYIYGKVGKELSVEQGYEAAKVTGIAMLATLRSAVNGDLKKVKRIVKVLGMVNCAEGFTAQPKVMNGFSDLMVAVFGEKGKHARSAVGMYMLPDNIAVEIEMIVEIE